MSMDGGRLGSKHVSVHSPPQRKLSLRCSHERQCLSTSCCNSDRVLLSLEDMTKGPLENHRETYCTVLFEGHYRNYSKLLN